MDPESYRRKIEHQILDTIERDILSRDMTAVKARAIAEYVLNSLRPHMSLEAIYSAVHDIDTHFPELIAVALHVKSDHDEQIRTAVSDHVGKLLKENKIAEATALLESALQS